MDAQPDPRLEPRTQHLKIPPYGQQTQSMNVSDYIIPYVIERTGRGERTYDIYSRLLEDRIVFIGTAIDDHVANSVMAQLLFLDKTGRSQDIKMYINSPGGSVTAGLAIYDTMQLIEPEIQTYCLGQAASMGAVLLAGGAKGKRFALPHCAHHDPPALGRRAGHGHGHGDPGQGDPQDEGRARGAARRPHRAHRPRSSARPASATTSCRPRKPRNSA